MTEEENLHKADQVYFLYDPQPVRLLDVIYVGPIMIYAGIKGKNLNAFVKWSLIGVGICTILYNGANFFINEKKALQQRKKEAAESQLQEDVIPVQEQHIVKTNEVEEMTEDIVSDNLPVQVDLQELDKNNFDDLALPQEVLQILNTQSEQTQLLLKKRGRPSKKNADTINANK